MSPAVPVSIAEEHRQFSGTLWTSESTFSSYVRDIVESLASHGFDRVMLVNGDGENVAALRQGTGTITRHDDTYAVPFTENGAVGDPREGSVGLGEELLDAASEAFCSKRCLNVTPNDRRTNDTDASAPTTYV